MRLNGPISEGIARVKIASQSASTITVNAPSGTSVSAGWSGWPTGLVPCIRDLRVAPGPPITS